MRVQLTCEARFERTRDGTIWGPAAYGDALWSRYLEVFSAVSIAARVTDVPYPSSGCIRASSPQIQFCALPPYSGLVGLIQSNRSVRTAISLAVRSCRALIVRAPSPVAYFAARTALTLGRPYGAEIVGDPDRVFAAGAFRHPLRAPLRRVATAAQKRMSRDATAVMFVTTDVLQRKYPTRGQAFAASDAALDDAAFGVQGPRERRRPTPLTVVTVGALDQPYKGTAVLLDAIHQLHRTGVRVRLRIVGAGTLMPVLEARGRALAIDSHVDFVGQIDRPSVRRELDAAQLFVLPSLTEGLPRALLEAMARGLPAVATNVGGIPELLSSDCLVPPNDAAALAAKMRELILNDAARMVLGRRNRQRAQAYHERLQAPIRKAFLLAVRDACAIDREGAACA
jgi:phosphatidyl-myo-inositol dimannoside synthase